MGGSIVLSPLSLWIGLRAEKGRLREEKERTIREEKRWLDYA